MGCSGRGVVCGGVGVVGVMIRGGGRGDEEE